MNELLFLIITINTIFIYLDIKNKLNPININYCMNVIIILMYILVSKEKILIQEFTVFVIFSAVIFYQVGFFFGEKSIKLKRYNNQKIKFDDKKIIFILNMTFLILVLFFIYSYSEVKNINYTNNYIGKLKIWFHLMRIGEIKKGYILKIIPYYFVFFNQFTLYLFTEDYKKKVRIKALLMSMIICLFQGSRLNLIMYIFSIIYIRNLREQKIKKILVTVILGMVSFIVIGFLQNKVKNIGQNLLLYILGGLKSLDLFLENEFIILYGQRTFRTLHAILYKVRLVKSEPINLVQEFSNTDILSSNVYTALKPYIEDFGVLGGVGCMFLIGIVYGIVYKKSLFKKKYVHLNAILISGLIFYFFDDNIIKVVSTWIQILFWTYLFYDKNILIKGENIEYERNNLSRRIRN